jgi:hypothetical protein
LVPRWPFIAATTLIAKASGNQQPELTSVREKDELHRLLVGFVHSHGEVLTIQRLA